MGLGPGEVKGNGVNIALHQFSHSIFYDSRLTYSIGSKKYNGDRLGRFGHTEVSGMLTTLLYHGERPVARCIATFPTVTFY